MGSGVSGRGCGNQRGAIVGRLQGPYDWMADFFVGFIWYVLAIGVGIGAVSGIGATLLAMYFMR